MEKGLPGFELLVPFSGVVEGVQYRRQDRVPVAPWYVSLADALWAYAAYANDWKL